MAMQQTTNLSIRMDPQLKKEAETLFNELGMSMSTAFNIFVRQAVREQRIPFSIACAAPNSETMLAVREAKKIARSQNPKTFANVNDLLTELNS